MPGLNQQTLDDATAELPGAQVAVGTTIVDALVAVGLVDSRNNARRAIGDGGASLNNVKVTDGETVVPESALLHGRWLVVRRGKKTFAGLELVR